MPKRISVVLSDLALMQMVQNALEAFAVQHLGHESEDDQYLESYGLLWGTLTVIPEKNVKNIIYTIATVGIDTSAKMSRDSCRPNEDSLNLKRDLVTSYWPQYRFLGDFHSHPYSRNDECDYKWIEEHDYYSYTRDDFDRIKNDREFWSRHNYRIGMVITIVDMQRSVSKILQNMEGNLINFTFGNYRMWIKAYYVEYPSNGKVKFVNDLSLQCPYLAGVKPITNFGRHIDGAHKPGIIGKHNT